MPNSGFVVRRNTSRRNDATFRCCRATAVNGPLPWRRDARASFRVVSRRFQASALSDRSFQQQLEASAARAPGRGPRSHRRGMLRPCGPAANPSVALRSGGRVSANGANRLETHTLAGGASRDTLNPRAGSADQLGHADCLGRSFRCQVTRPPTSRKCSRRATWWPALKSWTSRRYSAPWNSSGHPSGRKCCAPRPRHRPQRPTPPTRSSRSPTWLPSSSSHARTCMRPCVAATYRRSARAATSGSGALTSARGSTGMGRDGLTGGPRPVIVHGMPLHLHGLRLTPRRPGPYLDEAGPRGLGGPLPSRDAGALPRFPGPGAPA